jgi:hypothetical protein
LSISLLETITDSEGRGRFESIKSVGCGYAHMVNVTTSLVLGQKD